MRISDITNTQSTIVNFGQLRQQVDAAQTQVSSGLSFSEASENPTAAAGVMQNNTQLDALAQYQKNADTATRRVNLEESVLSQMNTLLANAQQLAVSQATATATTATRQTTAQAVNQLLAQAVQLGNTKDGNEFLFGGTNSSNQPFSVDTSGASYTFTVATPPPTGARQVEIAPGQLIPTNHDGTQTFGTATSGPLASLQNLAAALQSGNQVNVENTLGDINNQLTSVQTLTGQTGAWANRLQITGSNITAFTNQLTASSATLQDVDIETAMTNLTGRQTAYQAAMAATSRVSGLSLANYLT
jgi:flagellar hook-associated protein 3 FlgL